MTHDGRGVGRVEGKTVFVDGALRGELVDAEIVKKRRSYDQARAVAIHRASHERVAPRCAAFGTCGGCALQHQTIDAQRAVKREALRATFEKIGKVAPARWLDDLTAGHWGYRRKARLGVKYVDKKARVLVGFRERLKPYITDMHRCEVLVPHIGGRLDALAELIAGLDIRRELPQIEVAAGDDVVALVLRVLREPPPPDRERLLAFAAEHDVDLYLQPGGLETVTPLTAARPLIYALPEFDVRLTFAPTDFVQVHGPLNRAMVAHAIDLLAPRAEDRVLDLFCGLGNFTVPLARRARSVVGVEGDDALVRRARDNAEANGLRNVEFHVADLFEDGRDWVWPSRPVDLALIDPPRTGAQQVLGALAATRVRRIVYVSCHPGTLARDSAELVHRHGFALSAAGIMDMFPHTAHVESVAVFDREVA